MTESERTAEERLLEPGSRVEVRDAFEGHWHRGYLIEEALESGYRVRRGSDDTVLPGVMRPDSVRRERRNSMWWM